MNKLLHQFLGEEIEKLNALYEKIKHASILIETLVDNKTYIAVINELRDALDHIFKASQSENEEEIKIEIDKVKGHLSRAGYDVYELFAADTIFKINTILDKYDVDIRISIIPDYFKYIEQLRDIQKHIAKIRYNKKSSNDSFDGYERQIFLLIEVNEKITNLEGELIKEQEKKRKKNKTQKLITIISLVVGVLGLAVALYSFLISSN
jgi:hypothetical protein